MRHRVRAADGGLGLVEFGDEPAAIVEGALADLGEVNAARAASKKLRSEAPFECRDRACDSGRRKREVACGWREAAAIGDRDEDAQIFQMIHLGITDSARVKCQLRSFSSRLDLSNPHSIKTIAQAMNSLRPVLLCSPMVEPFAAG